MRRLPPESSPGQRFFRHSRPVADLGLLCALQAGGLRPLRVARPECRLRIAPAYGRKARPRRCGNDADPRPLACFQAKPGPTAAAAAHSVCGVRATLTAQKLLAIACIPARKERFRAGHLALALRLRVSLPPARDGVSSAECSYRASTMAASPPTTRPAPAIRCWGLPPAHSQLGSLPLAPACSGRDSPARPVSMGQGLTCSDVQEGTFPPAVAPARRILAEARRQLAL